MNLYQNEVCINYIAATLSKCTQNRRCKCERERVLYGTGNRGEMGRK
jgi:hypothetical protein